ncbi:MAG: PhzF family phenazine biosynthesis protein [Chitinophagaceae bacterium]
MELPFFIVDAFTSPKLKGNPTAVCIVENQLPPGTMLSIAKELDFPVTAFIEKISPGMNYKIKYFTTTTEIPACGHATLASSKVVFDNELISHANFETIENNIIEVKSNDDIICMTYPKFDTDAVDVSSALLESLGLNNYKSAGVCKELDTLFIEVDNAKVVKGLRPNYEMLSKSNTEIIEVVVTSGADDPEYDFILRSFCPWIGIDEDPVTGSVHSVLGGFWKSRLGKTELLAYQASERGGKIYVKAFDKNVEIGGEAITIVKGKLET